MNKQKRLKDCLIVFWLSIFAMILITVIEGHTHPQVEPYDGSFYLPQDTIRTDTLVIEPDVVIIKEPEQKKLNFKEQRKLEEVEWQARSVQVQDNMKKMDAQAKYLDSLLNVIDTTKVK